MLARDVLIVDLGDENYRRFLQLFWRMLPTGPPTGGKGPLLIVYRGLRLLKAIDLGGLRPVDVDFRGPSALERVALESGYKSIIALEEEALAAITGYAQRRIDLRDDYLKQLNFFLEGLSNQWKRTVFTYPPGPNRLPLIPFEIVEGTLRAAMPDGLISVLVVTTAGRLWCSAALGYRDREFFLLTSLDEVVPLGEEVSDVVLDGAAGELESRYGGKTGFVIVEKEALDRLSEAGFAPGALAWEFNTGHFRTRRLPLRARILALGAAAGACAAVSALKRALPG